MIDYEKVAENAGYDIEAKFGLFSRFAGYYWHEVKSFGKVGYGLFSTAEEAWKACCVENGLVEDQS